MEDGGAEVVLAGVRLKLGAGIGACAMVCFFRGDGVEIEDRTVNGVSGVSEATGVFVGVVMGATSSKARFWGTETETGCGSVSISITAGSADNWGLWAIQLGSVVSRETGRSSWGKNNASRPRVIGALVAGPCILWHWDRSIMLKPMRLAFRVTCQFLFPNRD